MKQFLIILLAVAGLASSAPQLPAQSSAKTSVNPNDIWKNVPKSTPSDMWQPIAVRPDLKGYRVASGDDGVVTASDPGLPGEEAANAFDGSAVREMKQSFSGANYSVAAKTFWLQYQFPGTNAPAPVIAYVIQSALDNPNCDPKDWRLSGTHDGKKWTVIDERSNQDFTSRVQERLFKIAKPEAFMAYRLDVLANHGDRVIRLAELSLLADKMSEEPKDNQAQPEKKPKQPRKKKK